MTPVSKAIESIFARQEQRTSRLASDAEDVRKFRDEDRKAGVVWEDSKHV